MTETLTLPGLAQEMTREWAIDGVILALWRKGLDTVSIARALTFNESTVANRLAILRDAGKL